MKPLTHFRISLLVCAALVTGTVITVPFVIAAYDTHTKGALIVGLVLMLAAYLAFIWAWMAGTRMTDASRKYRRMLVAELNRQLPQQLVYEPAPTRLPEILFHQDQDATQPVLFTHPELLAGFSGHLPTNA